MSLLPYLAVLDLNFIFCNFVGSNFSLANE